MWKFQEKFKSIYLLIDINEIGAEYESRSKSSKPQLGVRETKHFFNILSLKTSMHLVTEEGDILVLQNLLHNTYDFIFVYKMVTTQVGLEVRKKGRSQLKPSLFSKGYLVAIQRHNCLLQQLQPE